MAQCAEPLRLVPGPQGPAGSNGSNGVNGADAFTTLTANFTVPIVGGTAVATVGATSWMVIGQPLFLQNGGVFYVTAIGGATSVTLQNPAAETGNVAPATVVATGNKISPSGFKGAAGAAGGAGTGVTVATKGDIQTFAGAAANLAVGTNTEVLHADSAAGTGLDWRTLDLSGVNTGISGQTPVANGGTGAATAAAAATNLAVLPLAGGTMTGNLIQSYGSPLFRQNRTGGAADEKRWEITAGAARWELSAVDDAGAVFNLALSISRAGATPTRLDAYYDFYMAGAAKVETYIDLKQDINTTLVNGNNNNVTIPSRSYLKIKAGPTAAFAITGITGGVDGRVLILHNAIAQNMTIANESALSTASNRILTVTGADFTSTAECVVKLIYDIDAQRWIVMSTQG